MANKSKTYLLPYINDYIDLKFISQLQDTFLFYENDYKICLLYRFNGSKAFLRYEEVLMGNELFYKIIDIHPDKVLYVFDVPEELFKVIELFLDGKYSYLPDKDKIKRFLSINFNIPENHRIFHILDRSDILREQMELRLNTKIPEGLDLSDPPKVDREEFKEERFNGRETKKYSILNKAK